MATGPSPWVLVLGASGKTGRAVTSALAAQGFSVRAAVHHPSSAGSAYAAGASEVAVLDLATGAGLRPAVAGVWGVYHLAPNVHPDEVGMAERVTAAAVDAGVARLVLHSVLHPDDAAMPHHLRKAAAEAVVCSGGVTWTVLRPAAYHQNLVPAALAGELAVPYSVDAPFTTVHLPDVADAAAAVLAQDGHDGAAYDLVGPERLTVRQMAGQAAAALGRDVRVRRVPTQEWLEGPGAPLAEQARDDLLAMFAAYDRDGLAAASPDLGRLLGRAPTTWVAALRAAGRPGPPRLATRHTPSSSRPEPGAHP